MNLMTEAYITGIGAYLPGEPVGNEELAARCGDGSPRGAARRRRALAANAALPALIDLGVAEFSALVKAGRIDPRTEHVLCHYSAEHFRAKLFARLREAGYEPGDPSWFTNLHTAGNTGAASIFVMLDAARARLRPGDRVLLIVPESGRFSLAFAQLTCVGPGQGSGQPPSPAELSASPLGHPGATDTPAVARAFTELAGVWAGFQRMLDRGPVVRRSEDGTGTYARRIHSTSLANRPPHTRTPAPPPPPRRALVPLPPGRPRPPRNPAPRDK